ncbi:cadmium-translocating P-type ATPase [Aliarcobacter trophiarum LMG 25534]|uniref:P-type Zn(2+) transporter n=1 Tax=Aliarcobacter trophiarum LMG 25534 TaxID=1032241 RepID=A0AAD0VMQ7_9BACT|nr:heavy metal translocating P-type ATPase [Aliarcobacter trophiarum]AXK49170.1 heavy metal translocating P-type ATPase [Aliarcobacter trophiarum LMG 25534]RXJ89801.1 cadmium-translocating P-type ATPase [Aliarcobacter trophiarum LMG 25534]
MKKVKLENLDCGSCAIKLEDGLNKLEELENVKVDFSTSTLIFEEKNNSVSLDFLEKEIQKIEKHISIEKEKKEKKNFWQNLDKQLLFTTTLSIFLTILAYNYIGNSYFKISVYFVAYLLVGYEVLFTAFKNILNGKIFDENFLMSVATLGAFALGDFVEGISVMIFYSIGEMFQRVAVNNSRDSINSLIDIKPESAFVKEGENVVEKRVEEIKIGDILLVKKGQKVPTDSRSLGTSFFDTSAITGEGVPKNIKIEENVLSGFINLGESIYIKATSLFKDSTVAKIVELIENASLKKANAEKFITKFARVYTPIVVLLALFIAIFPPLLIEGATFEEFIKRALVFLVISCPCALVISVPLSFFSAIGAISREGVLVKGANYIEKLTEIKNFVFDKTGTLTNGVFELTKIKSFKLEEDEFLKLIATAESFSNHPIAKAIVNSYKKDLNLKLLTNTKEISGLGISAKIEDIEVLVGNRQLLEKYSIEIEENVYENGTIFVAINGEFDGYLVLTDTIKSNAKEFIEELRNLGLEKTYILSGDKKEIAISVAKELNIDEARYELLPHEKLEHYKDIKNSSKTTTAFVGDGINDAPTLALCDIGFAMGDAGSSIAIKNADIVVLNDNLNSIAKAIKIAKKTKKIVYQNIIFIIFIKVLFLILGVEAIIGMKEAIFADVGVALLSILNTLRILRR